MVYNTLFLRPTHPLELCPLPHSYQKAMYVYVYAKALLLTTTQTIARIEGIDPLRGRH